jgi:hypothetical protein
MDEFAGQALDCVFRVCDNAREACPVYPGHLNRIHRSFEDPAAAKGTDEERLDVFRRGRDEIRSNPTGFPPGGLTVGQEFGSGQQQSCSVRGCTSALLRDSGRARLPGI